MGRLITFVARLVQDTWSPSLAHGIGINEGTALLVEPTGEASITGWTTESSAYFLTGGVPEDCQPLLPLHYSPIDVYKVTANQTNIFNFATWEPIGNPGLAYTISAVDGNLTSSNGNIY